MQCVWQGLNIWKVALFRLILVFGQDGLSPDGRVDGWIVVVNSAQVAETDVFVVTSSELGSGDRVIVAVAVAIR